MKKLTPFLISCLLLFGAAACDNAAKTSQSAPNNVDQAPPTPNAKVVEASKEDAQSITRRRQANLDIQAREQRNNWTGGDTKRAEGDLESEVRSKLE
ncbi:hypothetical protein, partial [Salmonella enterica]|uniref:hypothetical protein n=1 Tax=Salmonella enterica TaxID=28901 RepID=UPI000AA782FC